MRVFRALPIILLTIAVTCLVLPNAHSAERVPGKLALLVGIDDYAASEIPDLQGSVNDIELIESILTTKFEFPLDNVRSLENGEATRAGIFAAFDEHLLAKAQPGDVVVVYYSGHGSRRKDDEHGEEGDGYDETLVPHDGRQHGISDISDDEIDALLSKLTAITPHVTFVFDSCHSGTASRGGSATRMIPADEREPAKRPKIASTQRGTGDGEADLRRRRSEYVLISGCLAKQLANEATFDGRRHGALTWFLARALQAADERTTYRSVMDEVRSAVEARFPSQSPQIEGSGADASIFGTDRILPRRYLLVQPEAGGRVRLVGGAIHGLREGAVLRVFPPGETRFSAASSVAKLTLTEVEEHRSWGRTDEKVVIQPNSRAAFEASMFGGSPIPVHLEGGGGAAEELRQAVRHLEGLTLVELEADARLLVKFAGEGITITGGDLSPLAPAVSRAHPRSVQRVVDHLEDLAHWLLVLDLENPFSPIQIDLSLRRSGEPVGSQKPAHAVAGERLTYRIENRYKSPLYIYLLDVSTDGSVSLLFPDEEGRQEELAPGAVLERDVELFVPHGHEEVTDAFKVLATTQPIASYASIFPQGRIRSLPLPQERLDPLEKLLASAVRGNVRGGLPVPVSSWATRQVSVVIRRRRRSRRRRRAARR